MKSKIVLLLTIIIGLLLTALIMQNSDLIWLLLLFVIYLFIGILQSPVIEEIKLSAKRFLKKYKKGDSVFIDVEVNIWNNGKNNICLFISDPVKDKMNIVEGSLILQTALRPGEKTILEYTFDSQRGGYRWDDLIVEVSDPFGCMKDTIIVNTHAEVFIKPEFKYFKPFPIRPWKTLSSPGNIPVRMGGSGTDFWGIREYQPGDPMKSLDWRQTARHPHKLFTREFVQEKTTEIALILDGRQKMDVSIGKENLFEIEIKAISSLAEMFLRQGYRVSLTIIGKELKRVLPNYGKKQLHKILNCLASAKVEPEDYDALYHLPLRKYSSRSLMLILSPVNSNDISFYQRLRSQGFQVVLISPDTLNFVKSVLKQDRISKLAHQAAYLDYRIQLKIITQLSISVISWCVEEPLLPLIKNKLQRPLGVRKM